MNVLDKHAQLRETYERETRILSEYNARDHPEFPGWTFLVPDVLKVYDTCPFLDPSTSINHRKQWLESQCDRGQTYYEVIQRLTNRIEWNALQEQVTASLDSLTKYVSETINDFVKDPKHRFESLMEAVKTYKDSKSKNKKVKDMWDATLLVLNYIVLSTGIDFGTYLQVAHNIDIKYKTPQAGLQLDPTFQKLCQGVHEARNRLATEKNYRDTQKTSAKQKLVELIDGKFQIDQSGKYYKRWSLLTTDQRAERVHSYIQWYCRKHNIPFESSDVLETFVIQGLKKKDIKSTDITWDSKNGIITNIKIAITDQGVPSLIVKAKPSTQTPRKRSSRKKIKSSPFKDNPKHDGRLNRLLLYHILDRRGQRKEDIIDRVLTDFNPSPVVRKKLVDYLSSAYDSMVDQVVKVSK